jgi:predicted DNA-binding WGR domain protein
MQARRFELSDGSSNKFWEISVLGSSFDVRFGRIGTRGQTQTKTFDSDAKATHEADKLVREKLAKGYREVPIANAPTPIAPARAVAPAPSAPTAPAATPAPPVAPAPSPSPIRASSLRWTADARACVMPRRSHGVRRPPPPGLTAVRERYALKRSAIEGGRTFVEDDYARLQREVVAFFDGGASPSARATAAAAVLLLDGALAPAMVSAILEIGGARHLVQAAIASTELSIFQDPKAQGAVVVGPHVTLRGPSGSYYPELERDRALWGAMRATIATLPDDVYAEARGEAERALREASPRVAAHLAFAFSDESAWAANAATRLLESGSSEALLAMTLTAVADIAIARAVADARRLPHPTFAAIAFELVETFGCDAFDILQPSADRAVADSWNAESATQHATAIAILQSPDAAAWLLRHIDNKHVRPIAQRYFSAAPRLAIRAIAPRGKGSAIEAAILAAAIRQDPGGAREEAAALEPRAATVVEDILARDEVGDEATASELPSVLASPPWASSGAKKKVVTLDLRPLAFEERIDWSHVPKPGVAHHESTDDDATLAKITAPTGRFGGPGPFAFHLLDELSDRLALEIFVRKEQWTEWWLGRDLLRQVARFDVAAIRPCLRFAHKPADLAFALEPAVSPLVARPTAHAFVRVKRARRNAERWLARYPEAAAIGLIPDAFGSKKKEQENAQRALRFLVARGHREVVVDVARRYGDACSRAIEDVLSSDGLDDGVPARAPKLPEWFDPAALPRPRLAGSRKALTIDAVRRLGEMLAFVDPDEPYAGLEIVKEACDRASLAAFAWALFQAWCLAGHPANEKWAFFALAWFGTDEHAHALAPMLRAWPSEGAFGRATIGLDVLGAMQSDVALMLVHVIAQRAKSRPLLQRAREKIDSIAESLGLSGEELADRLVPDLGLDDDGTRVLDFGPRSFRVGFDEQLTPFVRDAEGARLKELPKPGVKDDAERAASAVDEWKALKKAARAVASQLVARFEGAMIAQRRWEATAFDTYVVRHPLVGQLARRLVLGAFGDGGSLLGTFRIAEDRSYASLDDDAFTLESGAEIGVIHPLEIEPAVLATWGDRFADYEIVQPFAQLARDIPRDATLDAVATLRSVETVKLLGLERRGWHRGPVGDGGIISHLEKEAGPWHATLELESGIYAGDPKMNPTQSGMQVSFSHATRGPAEPDPIMLAEVVADLRFVGAL